MKRLVLLLIVSILGLSSAGAQAQQSLVSVADIKKVSPKSQIDLAQAVVDLAPELAAAGINTRLRMAHFLAQVMTETGGLSRLDENMNYSFKTLMRVFSRKTISEAKARELAGHPEAIANWVYGDRLGNQGRATSDGWTFRGSGYLQLTGRYNFRTRGAEIGLPLEDQPDLARQARVGLQAAVAYWLAQKVNAAADNNDSTRVRVLINGPAAHGLPQSLVWFNQLWTKIFASQSGNEFETGNAIAPTPADETLLYDQMLQESGELAPDFEASGDPAVLREQAIRTFQAELGLPQTGQLDDATKAELLDPREWRYQDIDGNAPPAATASLDGSVVFALGEDSGSEDGSLGVLAPVPGTGDHLEDANIPQADLRRLREATGTYAEYETGSPVVPDGFVPHSVIDPDDRKAVTSTLEFPARAIVEILFQMADGTEHLCTGSMISANTVLTAGHCIHSGTASGSIYRNFRVFPGRNIGAAPFGSCGVRQAFLLVGWASVATQQEARYYDMGALKLDCDVGNQTGWLGVRVLADDEARLPTTVEGYAADRSPFGRQWRSQDHVRLLWELKGFYQNDTFGGTSGAPVLPSADESTLVGVHTNGLHGQEQPWASNNAFTRITPERLARIQQWIVD